MQSLLTFAIEALVIVFAVSAGLDFVAGLLPKRTVEEVKELAEVEVKILPNPWDGETPEAAVKVAVQEVPTIPRLLLLPPAKPTKTNDKVKHDDLEILTVKQLQAMAGRLGLKKYQKLRKNDLIQEIRKVA